ncbi:Phospholipase YtpA [Pseudovibrio axinellae]|uniref:Phospholipase YtpA n=1 Tax=Pseudovibrio axinellae TaxID=989403 RepID=A0A165T3G1_9HYPH|nr:alpha/beta hydrolase [Pseudovibrio axinellae]KZL05375.1 Phospholipase YtpA [Pseudovibrio axinellae]SER37103.1 lysophospholipase [Pseudovibrio axinellae]
MSLTETPGNPIPPGAILGFLSVSDGMKLRWANWAAATKTVSGTVTIIQGFDEYIEKYFEVIEELRARGFNVVAYDLRGQGGSGRLLEDPMKGHVESFGDFVQDLNCILDEVALTNFPGPHYILSHSTGGAISLLAHEHLKTRVDRIVMSSPLVEFSMPFPLLAASKILSRFLIMCGLSKSYIPGGGPDLHGPFEGNILTSCPKRFTRMREIIEQNPGLGLSAPTVGWFQAAADSIKIFKQPHFARQYSIPSLIITAGAEEIVSSKASEELCQRSSALKYLQIKDARHELLMESDLFRKQFWTAFDEFIPSSSIETDDQTEISY